MGGEEGYKLLDERMNECFGDQEDKKLWQWIIQEDGDLVSVPLGFGHTVVNLRKCVKIAMDILPHGRLHRCMISYFLVW